jgi:hypothetical protein
MSRPTMFDADLIVRTPQVDFFKVLQLIDYPISGWGM